MATPHYSRVFLCLVSMVATTLAEGTTNSTAIDVESIRRVAVAEQADAPSAAALKPPTIEKYIEGRQDEHPMEPYRLNQLNAELSAASRGGDAALAEAQAVKARAEGEVQAFKKQAVRAQVQAQKADSLEYHLQDALEYSVAAGAWAFGWVVGYGTGTHAFGDGSIPDDDSSYQGAYRYPYPFSFYQFPFSNAYRQ